MPKHATRDSVFSLTETEQVMLELYQESGLSAGRFIAALGLSRPGFYRVLEKQRCILRVALEQKEASHFGTTSLSRARGRLRMDGTK